MLVPSQLLVDLDAIRANLDQARRLSGGRSVLAAVKANAYGHGLIPVARSIEQHRSAQWLGVATVQEAVELRRAGIRLPILKFTPTLADELPAMIAHGVTISVGDNESVALIQKAAQALNLTADVHLKVDTGMRRVGAIPQQTTAVAHCLAASANIHVGGIFTHLPVSDTAEGLDFTRAQLEAFEEVTAQVENIVGPIEHIHAANSGAILQHDLGRTTMVRAGIMAYGSRPDATTAGVVELRDVARWTSKVLFVKKIAAGETVGYGRIWQAPRDTWIATVGIGYADGYSRLLSSRGRMLIAGRSYPVVGRVCMDQTMVDLGPETPTVRVGDEVVLLGTDGDQRIGVEELAELMGTISYEVTCLIGARVERRYLGAVAS